jgi:hypothetical protein
MSKCNIVASRWKTYITQKNITWKLPLLVISKIIRKLEFLVLTKEYHHRGWCSTVSSIEDTFSLNHRSSFYHLCVRYHHKKAYYSVLFTSNDLICLSLLRFIWDEHYGKIMSNFRSDHNIIQSHIHICIHTS